MPDTATAATRAQESAPTRSDARDEMRKYLDPKVLSRINRLDIRSRLVVEGFLAGMHRSPYQGLSVEFAQHREYAPGDDTKFIDWRVYSRTDRYFLKQYEAETNLQCTFLVDASESMQYAGAAAKRDGLTKFHYAACAAAALSNLLLRQQDAVGLVVFDEKWVSDLSPSASPNQIKSICHVLERASRSPAAKTSIETACRRACESLNHRGIVCLLSDLFVKDRVAMMKSLVSLMHRGHDVVVLHMLDHEELTFPFQGNTRFVAMEEEADLTGEGRSLRDGYLEALEEFLRFLRRDCASNRIDYLTVDTSDPLGSVLAHFLARRQAFGRRAASKRR
jgi:uncharacterized protein (DUF58 family)